MGLSLDHLDYASVSRLNPYLRRARVETRGAWFIKERILADFLIVHIAKGEGVFSVEGKSCAIGPGDVFWVPPNTLHEMRGFPPRMHLAYAHFDLLFEPTRSRNAPIVGPGVRELGPKRRWIHPPTRNPLIDAWKGKLPLANGDAIHALIRQMALEDAGDNDPAKQSGLLLQLVGEIARGLRRHADLRDPSLLAAAESVVGQVGKPLDAITLARRANVSAPHFRRLFRKAHGVSARRMHDQARMQRARELILLSGQSISQIAAALGYSTVHNFSRAFRAETGHSPRAWRALQKLS